jgi:transposase
MGKKLELSPETTLSELSKVIPTRKNRKIDVEKAIELRFKGLTFTEIAKQFDVTKQSVREVIRRYLPVDISVDWFRKNKSAMLHAKQAQILSSLSPEEIKEASAYQKVGMFGILYDKARLEDGQSTENVGYADYTGVLEEVEAQLQALESETPTDADYPINETQTDSADIEE